MAPAEWFEHTSTATPAAQAPLLGEEGRDLLLPSLLRRGGTEGDGVVRSIFATINHFSPWAIESSFRPSGHNALPSAPGGRACPAPRCGHLPSPECNRRGARCAGDAR